MGCDASVSGQPQDSSGCACIVLGLLCYCDACRCGRGQLLVQARNRRVQDLYVTHLAVATSYCVGCRAVKTRRIAGAACDVHGFNTLLRRTPHWRTHVAVQRCINGDKHQALFHAYRRVISSSLQTCVLCVPCPAGVVSGWGCAPAPLPGPAGVADPRKEWLKRFANESLPRAVDLRVRMWCVLSKSQHVQAQQT